MESFQEVEGRQAGAHDGRSEGVGEEVGAGPLPEQVDHLPRPGHEAARGAAQGLAQGGGEHVDAPLHAEVLGRAAAGAPHEPGGVRVVDEHHGAVAVGDGADLVEPGQVAVHGEDAIGDHQPDPGVGRLAELRLEIRQVGVRVAVPARLGEPDAVDDRGVVEGVGDDGVLLPEQRLEDPAVGVEAGGEEDGVGEAEEGRQAPFQLPVQVLRAADEAHRGQAVAACVEGRARGVEEPRVAGEPQVVVGAEVQHPAAADLDLGPLRRLDDPLLLPGSGGADLLEGGGEDVAGEIVQGRPPWDRVRTG